MVKSIDPWAAHAIKREKNNDKIFRTKEKTEILSQSCGIPKTYIFTLRKDTTEDTFSI